MLGGARLPMLAGVGLGNPWLLPEQAVVTHLRRESNPQSPGEQAELDTNTRCRYGRYLRGHARLDLREAEEVDTVGMQASSRAPT